MEETLVTVENILEAVYQVTPEERALIQKAASYAQEKHKGQKRYSGLPYHTHTFAVGKILAELGMNTNVVCAGILHDVIEDCEVTKKDLQEEFNEIIAFYVDGVTHLNSIRYKGLDMRVKSLQKLLIATSKDLRVMVIKLADRLHNMQTLHYIPKAAKRRRIAKETQKIYAPIADRLGIGGMKAQLEELAFMELNFEEYTTLKKEMDEMIGKRSVDSMQIELKKYLEKEGQEVSVASRTKTVYSTYMKMRAKKKELSEIHDLHALRIIVKDTNAAYIVLGLLHRKWPSLPKSFKDYMSFPKPNGYQALHTRVLVEEQIVEVQILTQEMYHYSNFGKAAHFNYKDKRHGVQALDPKWFDLLLVSAGKSWLEQLRAMYQGGEEEITSSDIEADFLRNRIFVFTPEGEVVDLPTGAIVLDFAFAIHSDIGAHTEGAYINNKFSSIQTKLENGDVVDVKTSKKLKINQKWIELVKTAEARAHIRRIIRKNS